MASSDIGDSTSAFAHRGLCLVIRADRREASYDIQEEERLIRVIILAMSIFLYTSAVSAHENIQDCEQVRAFVAQHGKVRALAIAISHGATWKQIREAKKCLK